MIEGAFQFEGFLPSRAAGRNARLEQLAGSDRPVVIFEAPHRIADTLAAIESACGANRWLCLGRELTKKFEEIHRCRANEAVVWLNQEPMRSRGEYALVMAPQGWNPPELAINGEARQENDEPSPGSEASDMLSLEIGALLAVLVPELGANRASRIIERLSRKPHREIYPRAVALANQLKDVDAGRSA